MGNFLKSPLGSYIKAFLAIVIAYAISKGDVFALDFRDLLNTTAVSFLPLAIRLLAKEKGGFFNTVIGGYVKMAAAIIVAYIVERGSIYGVDWRDLVNTGIMSLLPVLVNMLNVNDDRYGLNPENKNK